ncbi:hypothetical protein Tco_0788497 [Tanacetum coccineum]
MYENFNAPSTESLDSIFNRLQKIISQLAILDLETMSFDDIYNNFKIIEKEVKRTVSSSSNSSTQNMAYVSSPSSTNDVNVQVSTASTPVSTADNTANLSDATVYAFLANQPNGSQLVHEDLEQIHEDDLEEMDLKWQLALLSMRARKYYQRTGKKITINGSDTAGYDKSKVECFNCHKMGILLENAEVQGTKIAGQGIKKAQEKLFMADEEVPTNMALMAFSDSEVLNDKTCSNTCLKNYETLKTQYDNLRIEFNKSEFDLANYKRGLASVEEQLVFYKKNEVVFCDQITVLKRDASFKDSEINALKIQIEKLKKDKESNQIKIDNFEFYNAKVNSVNTAKGKSVSSAVGEQGINAVKSSTCWVWRPKVNVVDHGDLHVALKDIRIFDSGCSMHMTGNKSYLIDYQDYDGGFVAFAGSSKGGKITGKGKIRTGNLDFEDVYFVKELKFNLFSVSQMCDRKNSVLFTETECLILSPDFKLPDENQVMLKIPRKDTMYSFDLKNIVPSKGLTCLFAKATNDEFNYGIGDLVI